MDRGERWRDVREKLEVGPVIVSALILDQFTGCTRTPEPSVSSSETPPSCCHTGGGAATAAPTRTAMERGVFIQTRTERASIIYTCNHEPWGKLIFHRDSYPFTLCLYLSLCLFVPCASVSSRTLSKLGESCNPATSYPPCKIIRLRSHC